jgi:signal peptidase II
VSDQVTKKIAFENLAGIEEISYLKDLFVLRYAENQGGFLGMGSAISENMRFWIFSIFVAVFLFILLLYLIFSKSFTFYQTLALSAILGGGIGNLIDRFRFDGRVVDFMNMGIGPVRTGIFNVADLFITFGAIFLFILLILESRKKDGEKESSE